MSANTADDALVRLFVMYDVIQLRSITLRCERKGSPKNAGGRRGAAEAAFSLLHVVDHVMSQARSRPWLMIIASLVSTPLGSAQAETCLVKLTSD